MTIAYLPINIDVRLPDKQVLIDYCTKYAIPKPDVQKDKAEYWNIVPVRSRISNEDWNDAPKLKSAMHHRYVPNMGPSKYNNDIDKIIPEIPYMLEQLPFKEFTMVTILWQTAYVPAHLDPHYDDIVPDPYEISLDNEPHRYNILLTEHGKPGFFVQENKHGEKIFPNITAEKPCYAFCERYHWHGSEFIDPHKMQLVVFGLVDRVRHKDMIIKNLIKNYNDAIILPDPVDPSDPKNHHDSYT